MPRKTLIIHGWSDSSESFQSFGPFLDSRDLGPVSHIHLADYESQEDSLTFDDISDGLHRAMIAKNLIRADGTSEHELNIIVHSTGGLVVRHWLARAYGDAGVPCPVKRLVMLAPANFGSPLARLGKSLFASVFRGRWTWHGKNGTNLGETGRIILDGLDVASPLQWELAHRDLLTDGTRFDEHGILVTIIVGDSGYDERLRRLINRPGTDGTVFICGCNLNSAKLTLDVTDERQPLTWVTSDRPARVAYAVLAGHDHGSVVEAIGTGAGSARDQEVCELLVRSLIVEPGQAFVEHADAASRITEATWVNPGERSSGRFQQFVVRVLDQFDDPVEDYFMAFFVERSRGQDSPVAGPMRRGRKLDAAAAAFHEAMTENAYRNRQDPSLRSFLVDYRAVERLIPELEEDLGSEIRLCLQIAIPEVDRGIRYDIEQLNSIVLHDSSSQPPPAENAPVFHFPDTTTLLEVRVRRESDYVTVS